MLVRLCVSVVSVGLVASAAPSFQSADGLAPGTFPSTSPMPVRLTGMQQQSCNPSRSTSTTAALGDQARLSSLLMLICQIPAYGKNQPTGWTIATGVAPISPTCPKDPLSKVPNQGYAAKVFSPQSSSGPELFEQLIKSDSAATEFATLRRALDHCKSFTESIPAKKNFTIQEPTVFHGHLTTLALPSYGDESAGFLQTIPLGSPQPVVLPKAARAFDRAHHLHLPALPKTITLFIGSVLVRQGDYLAMIAYFPGTQTFRAVQLELYVLPALTNLPS